MNFVDARATALALRRRVESITTTARSQPGIVRIAQDGNSGDQIAFWYANGQTNQYNLSDAVRQINALVSQFGQDILKSRSGQIVKIELPMG